ncbi:Panacea domain-containing protein [Sphingobium estronivorans]|uniref:Panacea domain-containing protein n=1 Tax=Sphingobium estronivorans TaxID=1577690 RepID=UPI00123AC32F|nr:type II toxin-antitoxin system antitoxin SocA domain-containing protein [Sphingobium estronivorans]
MADARLVANRLLELAESENRSLTPMQLLKLVYIAHGWTLGLLGKPLINQRVEAWQYGPVIRDVYNGVRNFGRGAVQGPLVTFPGHLASDEQAMIDQVYNLYKHLDGIALSNITHMANTPWAQTYKAGQFGIEIPNELIAAHYKKLAQERTNA